MLARSLGLLPRPRAILFRSYSTAKTQHIPEPQGSIVSHEAFLKAIGRGCEELGDKFKVSRVRLWSKGTVKVLIVYLFLGAVVLARVGNTFSGQLERKCDMTWVSPPSNDDGS